MSRAGPGPLVTVVTPTLNQGRFLRTAIESVLSQSYPGIEYLVLDGGSKDETVEILRSYGDRLRWVSEPDSGQTDAINKGFRMARGEIVGWLNADDAYVAGAVETAVRALTSNVDAGLVYGRGEILDDSGRVIGPFGEIEPFCLWRLLHFMDYILQPATFFRRSLVHEMGYLDEGLDFGMDWDLWIRLAARADVVFLDRILARSREHAATKTHTGGWRRIGELRRIARRHTGRPWTPGVQIYALAELRRTLLSALPGFSSAAVRRFHDILARRVHARALVQADGRLGRRGALIVPARWGGAVVTFEVRERLNGGPLEVELRHRTGTLARLPVDRPGRYCCEVRPPAHAAGHFVPISIRCRRVVGAFRLVIDCPPALVLRDSRPPAGGRKRAASSSSHAGPIPAVVGCASPGDGH